jgi:N-formylglutamate deformylase
MSEQPIFELHRGTGPLLVSLPHVGRHIPAGLQALYTERALQVEDTDWHLDEVYAFVRGLGASLIVPRHSRFVIDLNRPPENTPMYAGANNTELCPTRFFTGDPIYREGCAPTPEQIDQRRAAYWQPYHDALRDELARLKAAHGHAVLFDGHSIKSELPWLFEGRLPDLNLGTAEGRSCAPSMRAALAAVLANQTTFTQVVDGRFKGGHITRHYGQPGEGVHAVQLEMCWSTYMAETPPFRVDPARTATLEPVLRALLQTLLDWRPNA